MGFLMPKAPKMPAPPPPPPPPTQSDAEVQDAALKTRRQRSLASGRASNVLTGGQGVLSTADDSSKAKTLLGG